MRKLDEVILRRHIETMSKVVVFNGLWKHKKDAKAVSGWVRCVEVGFVWVAFDCDLTGIHGFLRSSTSNRRLIKLLVSLIKISRRSFQKDAVSFIRREFLRIGNSHGVSLVVGHGDKHTNVHTRTAPVMTLHVGHCLNHNVSVTLRVVKIHK